MTSHIDLGDAAALPPEAESTAPAAEAARLRVARPATTAGRLFRGAGWEKRYTRAVIGVDIVALLVVVAVGHWLGLGTYAPQFGQISPYLGLVSALLTVLCLVATRAWEPRVLGQGSEEFSRLIRAMATSAVLLGLLGLAAVISAVRPWVFGLIPLAGFLAGIGRLVLRKRLHRQRRHGACLNPLLAVGTVDSVIDLVARTRRDPLTGWTVTAACTPTGRGESDQQDVLGVPVIGDLDAVANAVKSSQFAAVAVAPMPGWSGKRLHQLAWDLEGLGVDLVVDPGLMEIAGPRLHVAPVDNLPLLRLTQPTFTGITRLLKSVGDRIAAALLLILLAPVMIGIAVAVRVDGGPVFFGQTRVGRNGVPFRMVKFRSMAVDAEARLAELKVANDGAGPLFKMRNDPRVTRVGETIRRYSLDELPQLFNVVAGTMSLVGPRPPLPSEVETYERDAQRKFLVKPGLTGLWQVNGRSDLSWEESVRLDLRYVENWTPALDALILFKTAGAMMRGTGAY